MLYLHMFLRRKKNKSGSESVQVVESNRSGYKVIKSFGSSCDELELRSLERKAQQWIDDRRGPKLPFASTLSPTRCPRQRKREQLCSKCQMSKSYSSH